MLPDMHEPQPQALERIEFDAADLMRQHPPRWWHPNKEAVFRRWPAKAHRSRAGSSTPRGAASSAAAGRRCASCRSGHLHLWADIEGASWTAPELPTPSSAPTVRRCSPRTDAGARASVLGALRERWCRKAAARRRTMRAIRHRSRSPGHYGVAWWTRADAAAGKTALRECICPSAA
jgi:hypothetical protein